MIPAPKGRKVIFDTNVYIEAMHAGPGRILARITRQEPAQRTRIPRLVNDALLAMTAVQIGATLYTLNGEDFRLIARYKKFSLHIL